MDPTGALRSFIEWVVRDRIYLRNYEATVERDHGDNHLDLRPDDARVAGTGLSRVPIRHGLPGVSVRVVVGSRVLLGFEGGDPQRPYASCWAPGSIESVSFDGGEAGVARQGDAVAVYWPPSLTFTGTITGAVTGTIAGSLTIGTQSPGVIQSGAPRVRA